MATSGMMKGLKVGEMELRHRITMSAMTRLRCEPGGEYPRALNAEYYAQRTSAGGLLVTEGTHPSPMGRGYIRAPGIWTDEQVAGWKLVTDAVHEKNGFIFCQLMHCGRVSHSSLLPDGHLPLAPSALKIEQGQVHVEDGKADYEVPHAVTVDEIATIVKDFRRAAERSIEAGFDGVEVHGGNGYILQQFMGQDSNRRDDDYGGSVTNRCRLLLEVVDACASSIGASKVGVKLQQGVTFSGLIETEEDSLAQLDYLGPELSSRSLAYVCMSSLNYEPYYKFAGLEAPNLKTDVWRYFRSKYSGVLMINGGLDPARGAAYVDDNTADLVSFGVLFLANANLPALVKAGKELNWGGTDVKTWYGRDPKDDPKYYTDWPLVEAPAA